jgi:hypothetical protein
MTFEGTTMAQVESWIDTRKADFNLMLPTRIILDRLKNGGEKHAVAADA